MNDQTAQRKGGTMHVRYDEVRVGDVGTFTDGTIWIARGTFASHQQKDPLEGRVWGYLPILVPFERDADSRELRRIADDDPNYDGSGGASYLDGCADTMTNLVYRA
jgi:hypothetical protein